MRRRSSWEAPRRLACLALGDVLEIGMRVDEEAGLVLDVRRRRAVGAEREPAIARDVGGQRAEIAEELLELLRLLRERAHLTGDRRLEERRIEELREALLDVAARHHLGMGGRRRAGLRRRREIAEHVGESIDLRLRDVRGRAGVPCPEARATIVGRREQHHRHRGSAGLGAQQPAQLEPRDAGHPQIGDHRVGRAAERHLGGVGGVRDLLDLVALLAQADAEKRTRARAVVDQENPRHRLLDYASAR
jgi:hypothetical protein